MGFPSSPTNGQQVVVNSITYVYNSTKGAWYRLSTPGVPLSANSLVVTSPNVSISTTSGALIVTGGAGIGGNLHADRYYTHTGLYWANNNESILGGLSYGNTEVAAYLVSQKITSANIGGSQLFANANAATQATSINSINANIGSYQTWANTSIVSLYTNANANTAAYLTTYTGNIQAGNISVTGNVNVTSNVFANKVYTTNGLYWAGNGNVISTGGGGAYTASNTAPVAPNDGDFWYKISVDTLYQYIDDGTTSYWVDVQSPTLFANTTSPNTLLGETTITGNLVPSANITYSLGTTNNRFKDLFLSGNTIDLGGATIKTDAGSGAIALIPQPTVANPNPTGIVVSPSGTVSTVSTTGGELAANAIGDSSNTAVASATTSFGNIDVSGNITTANLIANSNVVANKITTTTGFFWSNGTAFASSTYGNTEVAAYLVANPQGSTYSNTNVEAYLGANLGTATTNITTLFSNAATQATSINTVNANIGAFQTYANLHFSDTSFGNSNVASYLTSNVSGIASTTGAINIPIGTTGERPATASNGALRYNTTLGRIEAYMYASGWVGIVSDILTVEFLIIAGGGGGGGAVRGGGGGAGGYISSVQGEMSGGGAAAISTQILNAGSYPIIVGSGGAAGPYGTSNEASAGTNGQNSSAFSLTAIGGGGGGSSDSSGPGRNAGSGGSGGGSWYQQGAGGAGTTGQGYAGGTSGTPYPYGGGGGGASQTGRAYNDATNPCKGGQGVQSNITGTLTYRAGGGSSAGYPGQGAVENIAGGLGGGGTGMNNFSRTSGQDPANGTANTGGGGGASGNGGDGVVIIRYLGAQRATGGTVSSSGGYTIHTFTGSGSFIV